MAFSGISTLWVHMQLGPQSGGRLSPLQNWFGSISSNWERIGAGGLKKARETHKFGCWIKDFLISYRNVWDFIYEADEMVSARNSCRRIGNLWTKFNYAENLACLKICCKCWAGKVLRLGRSRTGREGKSWRRVVRRECLRQSSWRFSGSTHKSRRFASYHKSRPTDSSPFVRESKFFVLKSSGVSLEGLK